MKRLVIRSEAVARPSEELRIREDRLRPSRHGHCASVGVVVGAASSAAPAQGATVRGPTPPVAGTPVTPLFRTANSNPA